MTTRQQIDVAQDEVFMSLKLAANNAEQTARNIREASEAQERLIRLRAKENGDIKRLRALAA